MLADFWLLMILCFNLRGSVLVHVVLHVGFLTPCLILLSLRHMPILPICGYTCMPIFLGSSHVFVSIVFTLLNL